MVVVVKEGVANEVPVAKDAPPVAAAYQLIVPAEAVAVSVTVPVLQRLAPDEAVIVGVGLTVATTAVLNAEEHVPLKASAK